MYEVYTMLVPATWTRRDQGAARSACGIQNGIRSAPSKYRRTVLEYVNLEDEKLSNDKLSSRTQNRTEKKKQVEQPRRGRKVNSDSQQSNDPFSHAIRQLGYHGPETQYGLRREKRYAHRTLGPYETV